MTRTATLYRMVLPEHTCPYGVAAKEQLEVAGYTVDDRLLTTRPEVDEFKNQHSIETTPPIFIGDEQIGGMAGLEGFLAAECDRMTSSD